MVSFARKYLNKFIFYIFNVNYSGDLNEELNIIKIFQLKYYKKFSNNNINKYLWRSVAQYRAQNFNRKSLKIIIGSIFSIILLPWLLIYLKPNRFKSKVNCEYLKYDNHTSFILPNLIFEKVLEVDIPGRKEISFGDLKLTYILFLREKCFYPELLLKYVLWVSKIRPILNIYKPQAIIQYCEYSPYSSLRKLYLNSHGIRLVNITHGEEFVSCRNAFSSFDEYYCWNITPSYIYRMMSVETGRLLNFNPCQGIPMAPNLKNIVIGILWPANSGVDFKIFSVEIEKLSKLFEVIIRPHPNPDYRNSFNKEDNYFSRCAISEDETIHEFIDKVSIIIGYLSASLVQASLRGREVLYIIDDNFKSLTEYHKYYKNTHYIEANNLYKYILYKLKNEKYIL